MNTVRVYFNGRGVDVPEGAAAIEALTVFDAALAAEVRSGQRGLVDSRGLPADPAHAVFGGAIYRVVSARAAAGGAA